MANTGSDDLALLALAAAYEVDVRLAGVSPSSEPFQNLGQRLSEISFGGPSNEITFLHSDPKTIEVLARAFKDMSPREINDLTILSEALRNLVQPLRSADHKFDEADLTKIKDFCIALHRALAAADVLHNKEWEHAVDGEAAFY